MDSIKLYPTVNFSDSFAVFNHLFSYMSNFDNFTIRLYKKDVFVQKLTCSFFQLVDKLSTLEIEKYTDVVVFGTPRQNHFDSEILFAIYYDFCAGKRCIRFYL